MSDAPERVWRGALVWYEHKPHTSHLPYTTEYIRADIHERVKQKSDAFAGALEREVRRTMSEDTKTVFEENARLEARIAKLEEALEKIAAMDSLRAGVYAAMDAADALEADDE